MNSRIKINKQNRSNNKNKFILLFLLPIMQTPQPRLMTRSVSQIHGAKEVSQLSTLTFNKTPSPQLSNGPSITLTRFKSIDITEKIKKKLLMKSEARRSRRNQSVGNIQQNPQSILEYETKDKINYHLINEEHLKQAKAKSFFSKLYGQTTNNTKPSGNLPKPQLSNLTATLPIIHPRKQGHTTRANYLQIWLDEALDPQQITEKDLHELINSQESDEIRRLKEEQPKTSASFLSTIKKYQIDRQYLKSQNVPPEVVQRLYNTLFVYTHGINNIFGELMRFVKGSSEDGPRNTVILNNFWKVFIKLLEGCTSFQTTFQKVEENYMSKISDLKEAILKRDIEHSKEKQTLEDQIHRQEKTINEWYIRYSKLQSDHKINLSTLELTDHAFNEQVQLRLKFQQKINHIYSSYQELKQKYQDMMTTLSLQNEQSLSFAGQQGRLKQRIRQLQIALQEHRHLLKQQRTKVKQRQEQINLKKQQLTDLQATLHLKAQQEISQIQGIESQININSLLRTRVQQLQNRVELSNRTNSQLSLKVTQHMATVDKYRELNQELHGKLNSTTESLARYEAEKIRFEAEVARLTAQQSILQQKLSILQDQNQSLHGKLQISLEQLQEKSYEVKTKAEAMEKINEAISDLKAIKEKYQTLWKISNRQKQQLQHQKNKLQQKYDLQKEEIIGLKMLQQNRQKYIKQIQVKNDKQKQLLKRKITGYNESLTKKQSQLLAYQKSSQQKSQALLTRTYRIEQLQDQIKEQKVRNQRLGKENKYLFEKIQQLETSINRLKEEIKVKNEEMEGLMKEGDLNREDLMSARNLIQVVRQEENMTVGNFRMLYEEYRRVILKKGQHVHPMIVQDLIQQLNRAKLSTIPRLHQTISTKQAQILKIQQQNTKLSSLNSSQTQQIDTLQKKVLQHTHHIDQLQQKITTLNKSNLTLTQTIEKHLTQIKQKVQKISQKEKQLKGLKQQLEQSKQEATFSSEKIHQQGVQIERLNASLIVCGEKIDKLEHELSVSNRNDFYKGKVERLEKQVQELNQRRSVYTNVTKQEQQSQTDPQGQVVIVTSSKFSHKNKFLPSDPYSNLIDQQVQASLPPFDNIPQYLDHKITQIHKEHLDKLQKQKQADQQKLLRSNRSLNKLQQVTAKQPITRREQLRRALRVTYMRR